MAKKMSTLLGPLNKNLNSESKHIDKHDITLIVEMEPSPTHPFNHLNVMRQGQLKTSNSKLTMPCSSLLKEWNSDSSGLQYCWKEYTAWNHVLHLLATCFDWEMCSRLAKYTSRSVWYICFFNLYSQAPSLHCSSLKWWSYLFDFISVCQDISQLEIVKPRLNYLKQWDKTKLFFLNCLCCYFVPVTK